MGGGTIHKAQAYTPDSVFVDGVQQIPNSSNSAAAADNTFEHGWKWVFYVTVPTAPHNETLLKMKFADWMNGSNIITSGGNMRLYSAQSTNAVDEAHAIPITASTTWSDIMNLNPNVDLNSEFGGRQIELYVEAKIPTGSAGGSYSTSYDINTTATSSISFDGLTQTYNGMPRSVGVTTDPASLAKTVTYTGTNVAYPSSTTPPTHAGSYAVLATVTDPGYTAVSTETLVIAPAPISVVADPKTKVYDGATTTDPILTPNLAGGLPALFGSDKFTGALSRDSGENAGSYSISRGTLTSGADYALTYSGSTFAITQASTTVVGLTANDKPYDGNTTATLSGTAALSGIVSPDEVSLVGTPVANFSDKNVGSGKAVTVTGYTLGGASAGNYTLTLPIGLTADITRAISADLTATITASGKVYDGNTNATITNCSLTGIISPDSVSCSATSASFDTKDVGNRLVTAIGITLGGADAANYSLSSTTATTTATITKADLTITAKDEAKTYGDTFNFDGTEFTSEGLFTGDSISSNTLLSDGAASTASVGTYPITIGEAQGVGLDNYTITYTPGTLTVDKAALTIKADDVTRAYGETNPTLTGTITGIKNNDPISATYSTLADASSSVGTYDIIPATSSDTSNYNVTLTNGILTISKAIQAINLPNIPDKTYGDADFTVSATGGASGNPVTFSTQSTGICSVTGNLVHIIAGGNCNVTASQAGNENYKAATDLSQSFHITAANLVLTVPLTTTIAATSSLVSETNGKANNNAVVTTVVASLTPIEVRLQNIGDAASANVRISPIGANAHIQFWARDTASNWYDINVTGWGPVSGFPVPAGYDVSTDVYVISDKADSYPVVVNLVDAVNPTKIVASSTGTVIVEDRTPPTLNVVGFTENGIPMFGNMTDGYVLNTDNNHNTHYTIQFTSGSAASEALKVENVALTLVPTSTQTTDLQTFYSTNYPPEYQTYLDAAAAGTQPFAYIKADGTTAVKLLDGAQYTLASHESDMIVPGNYPLGTYTVKGTIHDIAGNGTEVTFKLIVAGDRIAPVGGQLTMVTKLHPNGITIATSTDGIYALPPLSLDGADVFQSMSVVVTDETALSTTSVPVYIDGNLAPNGEMVYNDVTKVWNYMNQSSQPNFSAGTHNLVATFSDVSENKITLTARFTTDNTPPTATVVQSGITGGGTITYTFSEPIQLTSNDSVTIYPESEIAAKLAVYSVIGSDYGTASKVNGVIITNAVASGNVWTLTYTGDLINQVNTKYVVDAWGYKITDLAGNQMLPTESAMFTVLSASQLITIGSNIGGTISAEATTGSNPKYEIVADSTYYISDVLVDNVSVIDQTSSIGTFAWETASTSANFTFTHVTEPHTIKAVFTTPIPLIVLNDPHVGPPYALLTDEPITVTSETSGIVAPGMRGLAVGGSSGLN